MKTDFLPKHPAKRFILFFAILYSLVLIVGVVFEGRGIYQKAFRSFGEGIFGSAGNNGIVKFMEVDAKEQYDPAYHTMIMMGNEVQAQQAMQKGTAVNVAKVYINDYMVGFLPTFTLLALLLATPMSWKRKLGAIGIGMVLITLFVISRQWVLVYTAMGNNAYLELAEMSEGTVRFMIGLRRVFVTNIVVSMMVPFLLWGMIVFRTEDLKNWLGEDIQRILNLK